MGRTIVVANQKGGVGKTTTAVNLSAALSEFGHRVLIVDLDPQGNATSGFGVEKDSLDFTVYDLILSNCNLEDCIISDIYPSLSLIPSNIDLAGAEIELASVDNKEYLLKDALAECGSQYDFIIIDCPPSLNTLTINAFCAGDTVLVPIQCDYYALEGLSQLIHTVDLVRERLNPELKIEGIVFTMYDGRTNLSVQVVDNVKENLDEHIFDTVIPRNVRLAEAPSYGLPIIFYDASSKGAEAYRQLANEIIHKGDNSWR